MLAQVDSATLLGVEGVPVRVEVDVAYGLPGLTLVGLAGSAVLEARERVRSAIRNSGFEMPARRVTVNLAPADLPKEGTAHDLAIALGILVASGQLPATAAPRTAFFGELALDGALRPLPGALALAAAARDAGMEAILVPAGNEAEACAVRGITVFAAATLGEAVGHVAGVRRLAPSRAPSACDPEAPPPGPDLAEVSGQPLARRALEIAVAGGHNLLFVGPPGTGKSLLLRCATGLLPELDDEEAIEVSRIHSIAGLVDRRRPLLRRRPVRAPHHTVSTQGLVGGGPRVRPGEASLAHRGALVLDELSLYRSDALDALRQPMETGEVTIARVEGAVSLPARFMLLAATNPCPCGWFGSQRRRCSCDEALRRRQAARISGPLRDRIDLWVRMSETPLRIADRERAESSATVATRVAGAWRRERARQAGLNAQAGVAVAVESLPVPLLRYAERRARSLALSPRRLHRTLRIARTLADLRGSEPEPADVDEALAYRPEAAA